MSDKRSLSPSAISSDNDSPPPDSDDKAQKQTLQEKALEVLDRLSSNTVSSAASSTTNTSTNRSGAISFNFTRYGANRNKSRSVVLEQAQLDEGMMLYDIMKECKGGIFRKEQEEGTCFVLELVLSNTASTFISAEEARGFTLHKLLSLSKESVFNFKVTEEEEDEGNDL